MAGIMLCLTAFLITINTALAIKCYSCDSSKNMACGVGILSFTQNVVECSESDGGILGTLASFVPKNCIKLVAVDQNDNEYIARSCGVNTGIINSCDAMAKVISFADGKEIKKMDCYTCDEDKCNSASTISGMAIVAVLSACFLFLF